MSQADYSITQFNMNTAYSPNPNDTTSRVGFAKQRSDLPNGEQSACTYI